MQTITTALSLQDIDSSYTYSISTDLVFKLDEDTFVSFSYPSATLIKAEEWGINLDGTISKTSISSNVTVPFSVTSNHLLVQVLDGSYFVHCAGNNSFWIFNYDKSLNTIVGSNLYDLGSTGTTSLVKISQSRVLFIQTLSGEIKFTYVDLASNGLPTISTTQVLTYPLGIRRGTGNSAHIDQNRLFLTSDTASIGIFDISNIDSISLISMPSFSNVYRHISSDGNGKFILSSGNYYEGFEIDIDNTIINGNVYTLSINTYNINNVKYVDGNWYMYFASGPSNQYAPGNFRSIDYIGQDITLGGTIGNIVQYYGGSYNFNILFFKNNEVFLATSTSGATYYSSYAATGFLGGETYSLTGQETRTITFGNSVNSIYLAEITPSKPAGTSITYTVNGDPVTPGVWTNLSSSTTTLEVTVTLSTTDNTIRPYIGGYSLQGKLIII